MFGAKEEVIVGGSGDMDKSDWIRNKRNCLIAGSRHSGGGK